MYIVQALHWIHDAIRSEAERLRLDRKIRKLLADEDNGPKLAEDLRTGFTAMPIWMQETLRKPLASAASETQE